MKRVSISGLYECAKQNVVAVLVTTTGRVFVGYNGIDKDVKECPRKGMESGTGYKLCTSVCFQRGHAETNVCEIAGKEHTEGSIIYLYGHTYCCENCIKTMLEYGVSKVIFPLLDNKTICLEAYAW